MRRTGRSVQSFEKWSFFTVLAVWVFSPKIFRQVKERSILKSHETIRVSHAVACPIVFILFCVRDWQRGVFRVMKNNHLLIILAVWVISHAFGQVREWLILELHGMIRVVHAVACPMDFNLFCDLGQHLGVLKMFLF